MYISFILLTLLKVLHVLDCSWFMLLILVLIDSILRKILPDSFL